MAVIPDSIIKIVKRYIEELEKHNFKITEVIIFGSYVKGTAREESDIDIALVSDDFTGDRFEDCLKIVPLRRKIDSRIEPMPFRPEDFNDGGVLAEEIKQTGQSVLYKVKRRNGDKNHTLGTLEKYAESNEHIILAFIFGSSAKGFAGVDSDFDVGVYLSDTNEEDSIWRNVSNIVEREVDLVVLNDAPATLISNVFKTGIPLAIKDRKLYWKLYLEKTLEAEDFSEFVESYWKIYLRSASLIPEDKTRLLERIQFLKNEFQEIDNFNKIQLEEYREDKLKRRNIERWTENIINVTIDIAKIILASEKEDIPKTYEQALFNFGQLIKLEEKAANEFSTFARLRNILAHVYLDVTYERIKKFIAASPSIYERIFDFFSKYDSK